MAVDYKQYLASREWSLLREQVRERSGGACERCWHGDQQAVHHMTYENVGHESLDELLAVCRACHEWLSGKGEYDPARCRYGTVSITGLTAPPAGWAILDGFEILDDVLEGRHFLAWIDSPIALGGALFVLGRRWKPREQAGFYFLACHWDNKDDFARLMPDGVINAYEKPFEAFREFVLRVKMRIGPPGAGFIPAERFAIYGSWPK